MSRQLRIFAGLLTITCLGACGSEELTEIDPGNPGGKADAITCASGTRPAATTAAVFLRSGPGTSYGKVLSTALPWGQTVCIEPAADGQLERTGGSYSTGEGSSNRWYKVKLRTVNGFVAASWVELGSTALRGVTFYVQVLEDTGLVASIRGRNDSVIVVDEAARARLGSAAKPDEVFKQLIGDKMAEVEAMGEVDVALVISGHSIGKYFFGDLEGSYVHLYSNPESAWSTPAFTLKGLAEAHPVFAQRVKHIFLLGCNTAWPAYADMWREPFPNAISVSGYAGSAPGGGPAYNFFNQSYQVVKQLGACVPQGQSVVATLADQPAALYQNWAFKVVSRCNGSTEIFYDARQKIDAYHARDEYTFTQPFFAKYLAAQEPGFEDPPENTQTLELSGHPTPRRHYTGLQGYINAIEADEYSWERDRLPQYRVELDQSIRLVFFRAVKRAWLDDARLLDHPQSNKNLIAAWLSSSSADTIAQAYAAATGTTLLPVTVDDIKNLNRQQTIAFMQQLQSRLPADPVVSRMKKAFVDLDPVEILSEYI